MNRRDFLKTMGSGAFAVTIPTLSLPEYKEKVELEEKVDDMKLSVSVDNEMVINFGKNKLKSSDLNGNDLWLPIDKNSFYGFTSVDKVDFDKDGIEDVVVNFEWGAYGSGFAVGNLVVSSKKRTLQFYKSFTGAGFWWIPGPLPEVKDNYAFLEVRDWMPNYPEVKLNEYEFGLCHSESMGFIFTQIWDGNKFEFKTIPKFYQELLPTVEEAVKTANNEEPNSYRSKMYERIAEDFRRAAKSEPISKETLDSSTFQLLREIRYE